MTGKQRRKKGRSEQLHPPRPNEDELKRQPADDAAARAKAERHGKVTADKWNQ